MHLTAIATYEMDM